ncbi:MAG: type II methionyl aminopeptidase [Nanoarchaeota archaeon]|nr:type II methionyl aminopeptidase [Nanoarchaeota archaeon]MBU1632018.1 type II methionyl aminopeptidase [Nanoarchaeota archaeon]MBU1876204.1 type II methionyl aminopeptidase [Nanoarchaeota archaeon]
MDSDIQDKLIKAGKIAAQIRREGAVKLSKPDTSFLEVMDYCERKIIKLGGNIAWAQMAVNEIAAHYCPAEEDKSFSKEGDVIKIDIGVHIDGYIADNAMTIEVSSSDKHKDMIKAAQNALKAALKIAKPGTKLWELGEAQYSEAEALGFTTIKNLSGHTLGRYKIHSGISIPSFNNKDRTELKEDWHIAIEPFVTDGQGLIKEKGIATIFMMENEKGARSPYARKILDEIKPLNSMPFTTRWLTRKFGKGPTALGLRELQQSRIIKAYPPLVEVAGGIVTQCEHSVIVKDKPIVYTRHENDEW